MRGEADHLMSALWVVAPLISVLMTFMMVVLFHVVRPNLVVLIATLVVGYVIALGCAVYVIYHLIKRRTAHFRRDATLREGILGYLKAYAASKRMEKKLTSEITAMTMIHNEASGDEREKSPVMWTILTFIVPFVGIYVLYFLTKDPSNHDRRQLSFMQQAQAAASKLGITLVVPTWEALPGRSFALYFIITILISFFAIYWFYVLIKDFNDHFKAQWQFEDQLVPVLSV